jgi:hypothetical protein
MEGEMDEKGVTTEQLRSIERWENEGGKVSYAGSGLPSSRVESIRNKKPTFQQVVIPQENRVWEKPNVWPSLRFAS